ncbi:MAG: hypothetical protein CMJ18_05820 [Phycisphaeraceae bacterium]|nr:hypothetical protein [Phycisphaeraceae bacterium]
MMFLLVLLPAAPGHGITVQFDQSNFVVAQPGEPFDVDVVFDGDDGTPGLQPLPEGLHSYSWEISVDPAKASVDGITVEPDLDFLGFAAGARITLGSGTGEAKGNTDQVAFIPYAGTDFATVSLTNLATEPDSYVLSLSIARDFPSEDVFIDGNGAVRDSEINFGTALVIVPEPATLGLIALLAHLVGARRARRH